MTPQHLISIDDLSDEALRHLARRGLDFRNGGVTTHPLADQIVGIYFSKTSTRTRTAFTSGALRLGARTIAFGPNDLQTNTGESVEDTAKVLNRMLDVFVMRTAGDPAEMRMYAADNRMSVINAMSATEHPTQALTDLTTLLWRFGAIEGLRILYVGEGNNTAAALALALSRYDAVELELRTPPGYGLADDVLARVNPKVVTERHDMRDLPEAVDVVYTTRWQTTGTAKPDPDWRDTFAPFQVTGELWRASPDAAFMHDLPAHRGEEVTAEVIDGPHSIVFDQAENKLHSAMAVLEWCR
ncbi:ornithine carbamoyltransferase [Nonomuraea ceibae]|uniref:ornithine carbamoyltransferase n=1 Tax=Nonomuraea ceibae TaxID=1935170 RepID=UPI001C5D8400|nr:ornithine carbamoyltransferase [Nonomuraea ceibae]